MPTDQQRVRALTHEGFSRRAIGALLGLEPAEVERIRRGAELPWSLPVAPAVSYNPDIEVITDGDNLVSAPTPDKVTVTVPPSGWMRVFSSALLLDTLEIDLQTPCAASYALDGEVLPMLNGVSTPFEFSAAVVESAEAAADPDVEWDMLLGWSQSSGSQPFDAIAADVKKRDQAGVFGGDGFSEAGARELLFRLPEGEHELEVIYRASTALEGDPGLVICERVVTARPSG